MPFRCSGLIVLLASLFLVVHVTRISSAEERVEIAARGLVQRDHCPAATFKVIGDYSHGGRIQTGLRAGDDEQSAIIRNCPHPDAAQVIIFNRHVLFSQ